MHEQASKIRFAIYIMTLIILPPVAITLLPFIGRSHYILLIGLIIGVYIIHNYFCNKKYKKILQEYKEALWAFTKKKN